MDNANIYRPHKFPPVNNCTLNFILLLDVLSWENNLQIKYCLQEKNLCRVPQSCLIIMVNVVQLSGSEWNINPQLRLHTHCSAACSCVYQGDASAQTSAAWKQLWKQPSAVGDNQYPNAYGNSYDKCFSLQGRKKEICFAKLIFVCFVFKGNVQVCWGTKRVCRKSVTILQKTFHMWCLWIVLQICGISATEM